MRQLAEVAGNVAVIGGGPGGLVAARWLLAQGFEPTIFEQAPTLGGQWTGRRGTSGVWPAMHTNTSRILTAFSDLAHEGDQSSSLRTVTSSTTSTDTPRCSVWWYPDSIGRQSHSAEIRG